MVNTRAKGNVKEAMVQRYYERQGWQVVRPNPRIVHAPGRVFQVAVDFYGLYDIIAIKPGQPPVFAQVTSKEKDSGKRQEFEKAITPYLVDPAHYTIEYWHWVGGVRMQRDGRRKDAPKERKGQLFKVRQYGEGPVLHYITWTERTVLEEECHANPEV